MAARSFTIGADSTHLWVGGISAPGSAWRYSAGLAGTEAIVETATLPGNANACDFVYDGVAMWTPFRDQGKIGRIPIADGAQVADYVLSHGGPPVPHAPIVSNISPTFGRVEGGKQVTIIVDDSTGATSASVGGVPLTSFAIIGPTAVQGITGAHPATGLADVSVTNGIGTGTLANAFTYRDVPVVTTVVDNLTSGPTGSTLGGEYVYVVVDDTTGATGATIGGVSLTNFTVPTATTVRGQLPAHAAGPADTIVSNNHGPSVAWVGFSYHVLPVLVGVSPAAGTTAGGTTVVFEVNDSSIVASIYLDDVALTSFTVVDATHVSGVSAAHAGGIVNAKVRSIDGVFVTLLNAFTFGAVPAINFLSPDTVGPTTGGTTTNIYGSGFTGATAVKFGGVNVESYVVQTDGYMPVVIPPHAQGVVDVEVVGASGLSGIKVGAFTYPAPVQPAFTLFSDHTDVEGTSNFGASGSGLLYTTDVKVDGVSLSFAVTDDTLVRFAAPVHARGLVQVKITTDALFGTSNLRYFIPMHFPTNSGSIYRMGYENGHRWIAYSHATMGTPFVQKVDGTIDPPEVIAKTDLSVYADLTVSGGLLFTTEIKTDGQYVFVGTESPNTAGGTFHCYVVIIDATTNAIVGHLSFASPDINNLKISSFAFDGAGNFFVSTTNTYNGTVALAHVRKYSTAAVIAAYPASNAAPIWTSLIGPGEAYGRPYVDELTYGAGAAWLVRYDARISRYDETTGTLTEYMTMNWNADPGVPGAYSKAIPFGITFAFGTLWVAVFASQGANYTKNLYRFNPASMAGVTDADSPPYQGQPAGTYHTGTGNALAVYASEIILPALAGGRFLLASDGTYAWLGWRDTQTNSFWRYSTTLGAEALVSTVSFAYLNNMQDLHYDGSKMWFLMPNYLIRASTGLGTEALEYRLIEQGPYGF